MANYTLTYSDKVKGWPSFYSFYPEKMIGMNQHLYSFSGGDIWKHNTNETRNNFYGVQGTSIVSSVFNDQPLENKLFKTISLEADSAWLTNANTDIQANGLINKEWYVKKEGAWFSFIRSNGPSGSSTDESQWELRSLNGIGQSTSVAGTALAPQVNFATSIDIGNKLSTGDSMYFLQSPYTTPEFAGILSAITVDKKSSTPVNRITIDASVSGVVTPIPIQDAIWMFIQNPIAESNGLLGHYMEFTLTNDDTTATELIAVKSEVMKSYP